MKIAMVSPYDFGWPGGVNAHVAQLSAELGNRGHEVSVVAPHTPSTPLPGIASADQFIPMGRSVPLSAAGSTARVSLSFWLYRRVGALMASREFDVVHLHEPLAPILPLMVLQHSRAVNVGTFHAYSDRQRIYRTTRRAVGRWQRRLHGRIAVSRAARSYVERHFPGYTYRVIPNGIDYRRFADAEPFPWAADDTPRILFVGRMDERKGLRHLLQAFSQLRQSRGNVRLVVVGPGQPDRESLALRSQIASDDPDAVVLAGAVSHEDLPRYYASADVFCSPAIGGESFGIVLLEAMAAGAPVVASDIDGYRDVVTHERDGLLTPPQDPDAIAAAILRVFGDASLSAKLAAGGRRTVSEYRWERVASEVENYYLQCMEEAKNGVNAR